MSYSQKFSAFLSPDSLKITKLKKTCQAEISHLRRKTSLKTINIIISLIKLFAIMTLFFKNELI